jgi:hypothetical protein
VIISTNKQVTVSPDIRKRAVVCPIDAAIPDQHATSKEIAHRAHSQIGTTFYRAYRQRLLPLLRAMREQIAERPMAPPDLLEVSSQVLHNLVSGCLGTAREWMGPVTNDIPLTGQSPAALCRYCGQAALDSGLTYRVMRISSLPLRTVRSM